MRTNLTRAKAVVAVAAAAATAIVAMSVASAAGAAGNGGGKGGGKPPRGTTSTMQMEVLTGGDQIPNWGDVVTFHVSTNATTEPHVDLTCTQGGTVVYGATTGYYATYPWPWTQDMTLSSQMWTGGNAACTARLYMLDGSRTYTLASLSFTAFSAYL